MPARGLVFFTIGKGTNYFRAEQERSKLGGTPKELGRYVKLSIIFARKAQKTANII